MLENTEMPVELKKIKLPMIGYVGGVHKWIDQELVKILAEKHPDYSFVFVGPIQTDISMLSRLKNVYFLYKKDHERLPLFIKYFNVCIIPYLINEYTKNVYPTKLNEYLAMGKAVVSTNLPEIEAFNREYKNIIQIAENKENFDEYISRLANEDKVVLEDRRIQIARENSWEKRIDSMSSLIAIEIEKKRSKAEIKWKENLIDFYKITRRKFSRSVIICIFAYLLLFKTPFIWFLAAPLKISEIPKKSDVIVVFGGGVGETGSPGKSTIERARYAAELYKKGLADKIIFSSGYTHGSNDAEDMKLIAISMGVSGNNIILEQAANSTYENVIFSKKIIDKEKLHSIILVSSPYNMRRAYLIFSKFAKDTKVLYVPVSEGQFYDKKDGIKNEQIRAIFHEYLGIVYYLFKGYLL
jgi:uncharacterized SAM-binding protein YcdF (DUF218 family)